MLKEVGWVCVSLYALILIQDDTKYSFDLFRLFRLWNTIYVFGHLRTILNRKKNKGLFGFYVQASRFLSEYSTNFEVFIEQESTDIFQQLKISWKLWTEILNNNCVLMNWKGVELFKNLVPRSPLPLELKQSEVPWLPGTWYFRKDGLSSDSGSSHGRFWISKMSLLIIQFCNYILPLFCQLAGFIL